MARPADDDSSRPVLAAAARRRSVLVVGTDDWAIDQVTSTLAEAGLRPLTCHPPGQPAFPCNALVEGRTCPLDVGFDVVVTVRARPVDLPVLAELGAICGLHSGAALVTAGMAGRNPFAPWASRAVTGDDDLATVVAEVAANRRHVVADLRNADPATRPAVELG